MDERRIISTIFIFIGLVLGAFIKTDMWKGGFLASMGMLFLAILIISVAADFGQWGNKAVDDDEEGTSHQDIEPVTPFKSPACENAGAVDDTETSTS